MVKILAELDKRGVFDVRGGGPLVRSRRKMVGREVGSRSRSRAR